MEGTIYLLVAGAMASWYIFKLHGVLKDAFLIDVGRAIDLYYYELAEQFHWHWLHKRITRDTTDAIKRVRKLGI